MRVARPEDKLTVYLSNLPYTLDEKDIKKLLAPYGEVSEINIIIDFETKKKKGMAFIEMKSSKDAQAAIKALNGKIVEGRTLKAKQAAPMKKKFYLTPPKKEQKEISPKKIPPKRTRKTELDKMLETVKKNKSQPKKCR